MNHHVGPWRKRKTEERKNEGDMAVFLLLWHQTWQLILIGTCPSSHKKADLHRLLNAL